MRKRTSKRARTRSGAHQFTRGAVAVITTGPSAGTIVRLIRTAYAPPGCDGCAVHTLQPHGPVWVVDKWVEWEIWNKWRGRYYIFRCKAAPWTALRQMITVH